MATTLGLLSATMLWASRVPIVGLVGGGASFWRRGRILTYTTETVARELLLRNEYLAAENRILKAQLQGDPARPKKSIRDVWRDAYPNVRLHRQAISYDGPRYASGDVGQNACPLHKSPFGPL